MTEINLNDKTPEELQQLIAEAQANLEARIQGKRKTVIAQIKELAASIGVVVEIHDGRASRKTSSVEAKYRNPENGKTWTGRGLAPKWIAEHVANGGTKEDFLIK